MDSILKGSIKSLTKGFGFITCDSDNQDYFFNITTQEDNHVDLKINDFVTFKLKANKGRKGFHATDINITDETQKPYLKNQIEKKNKFIFDSKTDMVIGLKHIKEKLELQKSKCETHYSESDTLEEEIDDLLYVIADLLDGPSPNVEDVSSDELNKSEVSGKELKRTNKNYWAQNFSLRDFGTKVEYISSKEIDKGQNRDFSIIWQEWKSNERQLFYKGYTKGHFNYSFIEKGSKEQVSVYDSPPPNAIWELKKIKQKEHVFYISSAPVSEIAQASSVPSLPPKLGIIETAERILDKIRNAKEWQREIDPSRIRKIAQFIEESNNIIANTPMLFVHDEKAIKILNDDKLILDFNQFLKLQTDGEFKGKYIDRKLLTNKDEFGNDKYEDYRPFWIIDGQHRVRGINLSENFQELEIPIIIFPLNFNMANTAKVFAEINTLQKKLDPLHELYMQHRFSIDHITDKKNFREYKTIAFEDACAEGWQSGWTDSRANHLAYEILAMLAKEGPLKDRVQFLPQNEEKNSIYVSADIWVNYARVIFERQSYRYINGEIEDYVFKPTEVELKYDETELFFNEINNYFKAWVLTCNHKDWKDSEPRWVDEGKNNKALIQRKTHFIILIELYNMIRDRAFRFKKKNKLGGIIKVNEFMEILKPLKWIDWRRPEIADIFPGAGERGRRTLEVWLADAIINEEQSSESKIFNEKIKSLPGQGILSELKKPELERISALEWPTKKSSVKFISQRPWNARYESTWSVKDKYGNDRGTFKKQVSKHSLPTAAEFILKHEKYMDSPDIKELVIRVDWKNSHTVTGHKTITIYK